MHSDSKTQGSVLPGNSTSADVIGDRDYKSPVISADALGQRWGLTHTFYGLDSGLIQ